MKKAKAVKHPVTQEERENAKARAAEMERQLIIDTRVNEFRKDIKTVVEKHGMDFYAVLRRDAQSTSAALQIFRVPETPGGEPRPLASFLEE